MWYFLFILNFIFFKLFISNFIFSTSANVFLFLLLFWVILGNIVIILGTWQIKKLMTEDVDKAFFDVIVGLKEIDPEAYYKILEELGFDSEDGEK